MFRAILLIALPVLISGCTTAKPYPDHCEIIATLPDGRESVIGDGDAIESALREIEEIPVGSEVSFKGCDL